MLAWLCGSVLVLAVLLGGGTHAGFLGDVVVQLLSIPLLIASFWSFLASTQSESLKGRWILLLGVVPILVIGVQLCPLPIDIWSGGNALMATDSGPNLGVLRRSWAALSITPQATWAAAASLLAPFAVFVSTTQLDLAKRLYITWLILGLGALSLLLGFLQFAQGPESGLRFYDITNPTEAVGFFANRNHFAALLYVTLLLGSVWFARTGQSNQEKSKPRSILWLTAAGLFIVSVVAGLAVARSRAGLFLGMAALIGVVLLILGHRHESKQKDRRVSSGRMAIITVLFAMLFSAQVALGGLLSRFEQDPLDDLRIPLAATTLKVAMTSLPFGAGLGSFRPVYATVENDKDVHVSYANRAHNDFLEFFLETGILGPSLLTLFLVWFSCRVYGAWFREASEQGSQLLLQRAATLILGLLLFHSLVDYPLRTTALSAVFAFFCGLLISSNSEPPPDEDKPAESGQPRKRSPRKVSPPQLWAADSGWPEDWRSEKQHSEGQLICDHLITAGNKPALE
jgi:O-antigen ligase